MSEHTILQFKSKIRFFTALLVAAVLSLLIWHVNSERGALLAAAELQTQGYARALSEHAGSAFAEADHSLRDVVNTVREEGGIDRISRRTLHETLWHEADGVPQIGILFAVNGSGSMVANSMEFSSKQLDVSDREYFLYNRDTPDPGLFISRPLISRLVNRWRFTMTRPLAATGEKFAGLAAAGFEVEYFRDFYASLRLGPRSKMQLIRTDGAALVSEPADASGSYADYKASETLLRRVAAAAVGTFHDCPDPGKSGHIVSFHRLPRFPVVAMVSLHEGDILAQWKRKAAYEASTTIALCLAVVVLMQMLSRHLDKLNLAQESLREHQGLLRIKAAQIDAATDAILLINTDGRLEHFNNALCRMTGYDPEELRGARLHDLEPPEFAARISPNLEMLLAQGEAIIESAYLTKSGSVVPIEVHARIVQSDGATRVLSIVRDISDRKRTEQREQTRLRLLEEMATGVGLTELLAHIVIFVEQEQKGALCSILLVEEAGGRLYCGAAPSLPVFYNEAVDGIRIKEGIGSCGTAAHRRQRVIVEDIEGHPFWKGFEPAFRAGLRSCWSEPIISSQGKLLGTFAIYHREPRLPDTAEIQLIESAAHLASIAIERVRAEEQKDRLEEQLHHVQKIEAVGQLAGGIAHDFNNLLTPIIGYAYMLRKNFAEDDPLAGKVSGIMTAAFKARDLTQQLLSFGRKQRLEMKSVDLNGVITEFKEMLQRTIRENISIEISLPAGPIPIWADRGQIEQILLNLAVNAQDAISGNGAIVIETGHVVIDDEYCRLHPGMQPGPYALMAFSDNGCGMDNEILSHIFEPFFTTKRVGHGTGLGLATVYGIIKQHEGYITVKTRVGKGTTFSVYLPLSEASVMDAPVISASSEPTGGNEARGGITLIVEDNEMVRTMTVELLESAGYRVMAADGPAAAVKVVQQHGNKITLLISDVVMPEMSGLQLYEKLAAMLPGLKVLFMSGYANEQFVHNGTLEEGLNFLQKPFTAEKFLAQVQRMAA